MSFRLPWPHRRFEDSVLKEVPVLFRTARRLGASYEDAQDLVGSTLLRAVQAETRFRDGNLRAWLIVILRNEMKNRARTRSSQPMTVELDFDQPAPGQSWSEVARMMDVEALVAGLTNLDEDSRLVVQLCDIEQMSYQDVAQALEVPIGTVRSRLFRAREKLRRHLAGRMISLEDSE